MVAPRAPDVAPFNACRASLAIRGRPAPRVATAARALLRLALLALPGLIPGAVVAAASPTTRFVSPAGSDDAAGTFWAPLRTIARCVQAMTAGDTCAVQPGVYPERVDVWNDAALRPRRLVANATSAAAVVTYGFMAWGSGVHLEGFTVRVQPYVDAAHPQAKGAASSLPYPGVYLSGHAHAVLGCRFEQQVSAAVQVGSVSQAAEAVTGALVSGNVIVDAETAGITAWGTGHVIERNDVSGSRQFTPGYTVYDAGDDADGMRVHGYNLTVRWNRVHGIHYATPGNHAFGHAHAPHIDGIQVHSTLQGAVFEGNVIDVRELAVQSLLLGSRGGGEIRDVVIRNNVFVNHNLDPARSTWGPAVFLLPRGDAIANVTIVHNTFVRAGVRDNGTAAVFVQPEQAPGGGAWGVVDGLLVAHNVADGMGMQARGHWVGQAWVHEHLPAGRTHAQHVLNARVRRNLVHNDAAGVPGYGPPSRAGSRVSDCVPDSAAAPCWSEDELHGDPLFVHRAAGDFRLRAGSPAVDQAVLPLPPAALAPGGALLDATGRERRHGPHHDLGAFELRDAPVAAAAVGCGAVSWATVVVALAVAAVGVGGSPCG